MPTRTARPRSGFTLIEILVVVAIIGIAGALVVPSMLSAGTLGLQGAARLVIADISYAQNEALASGRVRGIEFDPVTDRYRMFDERGVTIDLKWMRTGGSPATTGPDGNPVPGWTVDFPNDSRFAGIEIAGANLPEEVDPDGGDRPLPRIRFDALGAPMGAIDDGTIQLRHAGNTVTISIDSFTGAVTVK